MQLELIKTKLKNLGYINLLTVALGGVLALLLLDFPYLPIIACLGLIVFLIYAKAPLAALALLILLLPYGGTVLFNIRLVDVPGAKPLNFIAMFVLLIAMINYKKSAKLPPYAFYFAITMIVLFSISFIRSLPYLKIFSFYWENNLSTTRYFLSYFMKPLIFFIPFVIIGKFAYKREHIEYIVKIIGWTIVLLSGFIIFMYLFKCPYKFNIEFVRGYFESMLGLHANGVACFYIIAFPVILARLFIKKDAFNILSICLCSISIGLLYSRTAYALAVFSAMFYLVISKRGKLFPAFFIILAILIFILPANIKERAVSDMHTRDINRISAGRVESIWIPLVSEYVHNPKKLIFGNGRYGILSSSSFAKSAILDVDVSHNMYLEQVLDCGLIGLAIFLYFFSAIGRKIYISFHRIKDKNLREYQYAAFTALAAHLISGMTGRSFFPEQQNIFLWVVLGYSICIVRMVQCSKPENIGGYVEEA